MPTDKLVDVVFRMTFDNVRKSQVETLKKDLQDSDIHDCSVDFDNKKVEIIELVDDVPHGVARQINSAIGGAGRQDGNGRQEVEKEKSAVTGGVSMPAAKTQKLPKLKITGKPVPANFEKLLLEYIRDNPRVSTKDIRNHFNVTPGGAAYYIKQLAKAGKIRSFHLGDNTKLGSGYEIVEEQKPVSLSVNVSVEKKPAEPLPKKTLEEQIAYGEKRESKGGILKEIDQWPIEKKKSEELKPEQAVQETRPVIPQKIKDQFAGMVNGSDRDSMIKAKIQDYIEKNPGVGTAEISHNHPMVNISKIRRFLVELEEDKKIRSEKVQGAFSPRTCYFPFNNQVPVTAETNAGIAGKVG